MASDTSYFTTPRERLQWGIEAVRDFDTEARDHFDAWPARRVMEINAETGEEVDKIVFSGHMPRSLSKHANRAIEDIKNVFDQATFAFCKSVNAPLRSDTVYFPWAESEAGLRGRLIAEDKPCKPARKHVLEPYLDIFLGLKPYGIDEGCTVNDVISRQLAQIANRKHTVGLTISAGIGRMDVRTLVTRWIGRPEDMPRPRNLHWDAVKNEIVVSRGPIGSHRGLSHETKFAMNVSLDEPAPLKGHPFVQVMEVFATKAQHVIDTLEGEAIKIGGSSSS